MVWAISELMVNSVQPEIKIVAPILIGASDVGASGGRYFPESSRFTGGSEEARCAADQDHLDSQLGGTFEYQQCRRCTAHPRRP